ncbi:AzlC family ABC transporter permease [Flaviflexus massiliensis]|uniref:AzlC family ABC transporter permease n=1 Tax=Flaviflexus massiliensis TaxID=1522309 RepID=UPI0006D58AAC|nr:AzlC family ABC transporter permease [Flaviflexus massiliensis]
MTHGIEAKGEVTGQYSRRHEVLTGVRLSFAAGLGMFPLGIAFGLLVIQAGLPWWIAPALSIFGYAGSLELLLVGMIATTTPIATIAVTSLLVNFRHVFYAFSFPLRVVKNPLAKTYSMYSLTDEAYAVTAAKPDGWSSWRLISLQMALQSYWVLGGLSGVLIGSLLPEPIEGLDFALCALFITLALDAAKTKKEIPSVLLAAASYAFAIIALPEQALFSGMLIFVVVLLVRYAWRRYRAS